MDKARKELEEGLGDFIKQLSEIDEYAQIILKGHIVIEQKLNEIIRYIFFHPDYVLNARLRFEQKLEMVRAYSVNAHDHLDWSFLRKFNELRNIIAHEPPGERRTQKMAAIHTLFLDLTIPDQRLKYKNSTQETFALSVCMRCAGFLEYIGDDLGQLYCDIRNMMASFSTEAQEKLEE